MTNGLPDNFANDWGALKNDIDHIKKKVDEAASDIKELPCKGKNGNPLLEIARLKANFATFKWFGGIILAGFVSFIVWSFRKLLNGG